jgi:tetratricopeptide (TPR) repeat protein
MIRGTLRTLLGDPEVGLAEAREAKALLDDVGHRIVAAGTSMMIGESELLAGNPAGAEQVLRDGYTRLKEHGETGYFSSIAAALSHATLALGHEDDALEIADEVLEIAADDDFDPIARARAVRALVFARRGLHEDAAAEIGSAVERVEKSDYLNVRALIALAEADVAALAGRTGDEQAALRRAMGLADQKGDRLTQARVRERLA